MDNGITVTVTVNGWPVEAAVGMTLSEITHGDKPCGGHGKCGKCRVVAHGKLLPPSDAERRLLSEHELARGVRLACLTRAMGDCEIETMEHLHTERILTESVAADMAWCPSFSRCGVAVDVGTTTLAARLYDANGALLAEASRLNPQSECGADVVSRIEVALGGGADKLAGVIRGALNEIMVELTVAAQVNAREIDRVVITGNTVMLSLLVGESVEPFSHAPFAATRLFDETLTAAALALTSLPPDTPIYLPPCISAFVGADTVCALVATRLCEGDTAMLADIGTNGELALWHDGQLTVCSTAAGPAFEGVDISCGMRGAVGAIDRVAVVNGRLYTHVIGDVAPIGICGSGLVDAVACMLQLELMDESGYLEDGQLMLGESVSLTQKDIRMLQLAKSAMCAGLWTLIDEKGLSCEHISALYIAGGFGNYLNMQSASAIGLLPPLLARRARAVGNAALEGAAMLLNDEYRSVAKSLTERAVTVELSSNPVFSDRYMNGMLF